MKYPSWQEIKADIEQHKVAQEKYTRTNQQATANHTIGMVKKMRYHPTEIKSREKHEMTRNEARNKLKMVGSLEADKALNMLEALGLIKFDEEMSVEKVIGLNSPNPKWIVDCLDRYGYKIVKK